MLFSRKTSKLSPEEEAALVGQILELIEELRRPARFLADLDAVWSELSDGQRAEIEESRVYRERFHERRADETAAELHAALGMLPGGPYREVRAELVRFLRGWRNKEPDGLKIFAGLLKQALAQSERPASGA